MKEWIGILFVMLGAVVSAIAGTGEQLSIATRFGIGIGECVGITLAVVVGPVLIILGIRDKDKAQSPRQVASKEQKVFRKEER